jgi:CRISPR system Cascade subunit CasC
VKIELHLLQNFAPSNLNRDDTGAPKDCEFGGHRRARISSQCQKRAVRQAFQLQHLVDDDQLGKRTKRLIHKVAEVLQRTHDYPEQEAVDLAIDALEGVGLGRNKKGDGEDLLKTEYLLFVPGRIVVDIADVLHKHRAELRNWGAQRSEQKKEDKDDHKKADKKEAKKKAEGAYPKQVQDAVEQLLHNANRTVDVALFGRMIADKPEWNVDAACQVAQAISTNRVQMDFDFFTAVDDLKPRETAGSDMMGTVQFNSSCFYRYAVLDIDSLRKNLEGDDALVRGAVRAFLQAFITAIPTGKQNGMAAHNFPSYALAVVRDKGQPLSFANAFLKPARPRGEDVDLVDNSIEKLESYAARLREALGEADWISWSDRDLAEEQAGPRRAKTLRGLYDDATNHAVGKAS